MKTVSRGAGMRAVIPGALTVVLVWIMTTALLLSLAGFWRQAPSPDAVWLLAACATGVGVVMSRWPWLTLGTAWAMLMAGLGLTPQLHVWLLERWNSDVLGQAAALALATSAHLVEQIVRTRAGQIETMAPSTAWIALGFTGLGAVLFISREARLRGSAVRSLAAGAVLFGFQWLLYYDKAQPTLLVFLLAGLVLWAQARWARQHRDWQQKGWHVKAPPLWTPGIALALVVALAATLWPVELEPADLGAATDRMRQTMPWLLQLRGASGPASGSGSSPFSLATTGFGNPAVLGGPVQPDDRPALKVHSSRPITGNLYMRGAVETHYNTAGWRSVGNPILSRVRTGAPLPAQHPAAAVSAVLDLQVTPLQFSTRSLFYPQELVRVDGLRETVWSDANGSLTLEKPLPDGRTYRIESRVAAGEVDTVKALLRSNALPGPELTPALELPLVLPERVRNLARTVVGGIINPVDQARAIEEHLRKNYPYRLDVPAPARNRDFVDQFLFGTRAGYCTYFSTAMVVMLREVGIPARWVQGFAAPGGGRTEITFSLANAHAWVEAYFPGYGWVTFDPTPHPSLAAIPRQPESEVVAATAPATRESESAGRNDPELPPETLPGADEITGQTSASGHSLWQGIAMAAVLALLMTAVVLWWGAWRQRRPEDAAAALQAAFVRLQRLLPFAGRRPGGQTPREYAAAVADQYPELAGLIAPVAAEYERLRFGPPEWAPDPERLRQAWELLRQARRLRRHTT